MELSTSLADLQLRNNKNNILNKTNKRDLIFQITDIKSYDESVDVSEFESDDDNSSDDEKNKGKNNYEQNTDKYFMTVFGITLNDIAVSVKIYGFEPYFYVYAPEVKNKDQLDKFIKCLKSNLSKKFQLEPITNYGFIERKKFVGFDPEKDKKTGKFIGNKKHQFICIKFRSKRIMQMCASILTPKDDDGRILNGKRAVEKMCSKRFELNERPKLYESNIDPLLRFLHVRDLQSCGWAMIKCRKYVVNDIEESKNANVQLDITVDWKNINPVKDEANIDKSDISKMIVASFDIEADSSHGDFPIAMKDFKKLAANVYDATVKYVKHKKEELKKQQSNIGGSTMSDQLLKDTMVKIQEYIMMGYSNVANDYNIEYVYSKHGKKPGQQQLKKLSKLIVNLFFMDSQVFQVHFNDVDIPKGTIFKIKYDDEEAEEKYPKKEIRIGYSLVSNVQNNDIGAINEDTNNMKKKQSYCLQPGDMIVKYGSSYKLIHNKHSSKYNFVGELRLFLNIKDKKEGDRQLSLSSYTGQTTIDNILEKLVRKRSLKNGHIESIMNFSTCFEEFNQKRDLIIEEINKTMLRYFPEIEGDRIIQIGTVVQKYGDKDCYLKHIITLNGCSDIEGVVVESYETEREVIVKWCEFINRLDPDIITGYNIFTFDYKFIWERALELNCAEEVSNLLTRMKSEAHLASLETLKLSSAGLGDNVLSYINMPGRISVDLYKVIQRDHKLNSYKLSDVSSNFINGNIETCVYKDMSENDSDSESDSENESDDEGIFTKGNILKTNNIIGLVINNYITIGMNTLNGVEAYDDGKKHKILHIDKKTKTITLDSCVNLDMENHKFQWGLVKDDVGPKDIFRLQKGTNDDRAIVAKYCVMDCELVINIANKLDIITNNIGMANVCSVPLSFIFLRGQGIKIFSLVAKQCRLENTLIPVLDSFDDNGDKDGYEGAVVLKPKPGIYLNEPVAVLDYSSLYPSSMISENLSHDTLVLDPLYLGEAGARRLQKMGLKHEDITYTNYKYVPKGKQWIKIVNENMPSITCRYVQPYEVEEGKIDDKRRGIIPRILQKLLGARKSTRNKIPDEPDEFKKAVLDGLQLAYKVTANSLYGALGAKTSQVYLKDIAASTTATGRKLLEFAKNFVEKNYPGSDTIYGDSVVGDEPLILRKPDGTITIKTIETLSDDWEPYEHFKPFDTYISNRRNKQKSKVNYEVWANDKWNPIIKVIRHKTNKKIYRVNTHSGVVDVSEDHSLLDEKLNKIKPTECVVGKTFLSHTYPMFYDYISDDVDSYHICEDELQLSPMDIPNYVLNLRNKEMKVEFFNRYHDDFAIVNNGGQTYFKFECKIHMAKLYYLLKSLGFYLSIKIVGNENGSYLYYFDTQKKCNDFNKNEEPNMLKNMVELRNSEEEYVYDLETQDGIFHCGVGEIQVKNTDSVFMSFKQFILKKHGNKLSDVELLSWTIKYGMEAGDRAKKLLKRPHDLEYEKTFFPFILLSKKRYVGNKYEKNPLKFKQTSMGIVLKRRDNAPIVKYIYGGIIDRIINVRNIDESIRFLKKTLQELLDGKFSIDNLIITKTLKGYYKVPDQIAHKVLADRMGNRDAGNKPQSNDRIPFVYIESNKKEKLQGNKIENPKYIIDNNLPIDYAFYITNQILKPVSQIYALILEKLDGYNKPVDYYVKYRHKLEKKQPDKVKLNKKIQDERMKDIKNILFIDALRQCENNKNNTMELTQWFSISKVEHNNDDNNNDDDCSSNDNDDNNDCLIGKGTKSKLGYQNDEEDEENQGYNSEDYYSDYEDTYIEF